MRGSFTDEQVTFLQNSITLFKSQIGKMKTWLETFTALVQEQEKKFDAVNKNLQKFTSMLFEYESLSVETYNPHDNTYLGTPLKVKEESLHLFDNPENQDLKAGFSSVIQTVVNPFKEMRMWLRHEI